MSCLYILEIKLLLVTSFANIFFWSLGCLFILFMVSFAVQKLVSLIRSHLYIFPFISIALGDWPKKTLAWFMSENVLPLFSSSFMVSSTSRSFMVSSTLIFKLFFYWWMCWLCTIFFFLFSFYFSALINRSAKNCAYIFVCVPVFCRINPRIRTVGLENLHFLDLKDTTILCRYFLPFCGLSFHFVYGFLCYAKLLSLIRSHLFIFGFIFITLGGGSNKMLQLKSKSVLPIFSSKSFTVSSLTFMYLIHFEFSFVYSVRECSNLILLYLAVQFSQDNFLKRLSSLHFKLLS